VLSWAGCGRTCFPYTDMIVLRQMESKQFSTQLETSALSSDAVTAAREIEVRRCAVKYRTRREQKRNLSFLTGTEADVHSRLRRLWCAEAECHPRCPTLLSPCTQTMRPGIERGRTGGNHLCNLHRW
jgi:hypothetical protein